MFENLKHHSGREGKYEDRPDAGTYPSRGFSPAASATSFTVQGNEASRLVRCKICGFPCDTQRDGQADYDTWAGLGINQGETLTAGTSIGDARVPAAGVVNQKPDTYYNRDVTSGCPLCASFVYDK